MSLFCQVTRVVGGNFRSACSDVDLGLGVAVLVMTFKVPKTSDSFVLGFQCRVPRARAGGAEFLLCPKFPAAPVCPAHGGDPPHACLPPVTIAAPAAVPARPSQGQEGSVVLPRVSPEQARGPGSWRARLPHFRLLLPGMVRLPFVVGVGLCELPRPPCCSDPRRHQVRPGARPDSRPLFSEAGYPCTSPSAV